METPAKFSAFQIFYNRDENYTTDLQTLEIKPTAHTSLNYQEYMKAMNERIQTMREQVLKSKKLQRKIEDKKHKSNIRKIEKVQIGCFVYIWTLPHKTALYAANRKFQYNFLGPYIMLKVNPDNFVIVCSLDGEVISQPIHLRHIKVAKIRCGRHYAQTIDQLVDILNALPHQSQQLFSDQLKSLTKLAKACHNNPQ